MTTDEITAILADHALWFAGKGGKQANLTWANLAWADFTETNLTGVDFTWATLAMADFTGANLCGAIGNMREVKSAQFDCWPLVWTTAPDGVVTLQIGCQRHPLDLWIKSDPDWIADMQDDAPEWWAKHRDIVLTLVQASPATPWGQTK